MAGYSLAGNQVICVPCEFVDYCMKDANPTFIAVYLYGFRQCFSAKPKNTVSDAAAALGLLESDVVKAWNYWEERGVVTLRHVKGGGATDFSIEFCDLSALSQAAAPKKTSSKCKTPRAAETPPKEDRALSDMRSHAEMLLNRPLSLSDMNILYDLYGDLGLPPEVILMIVEHCVSLDKRSMRYVRSVAESWADAGIRTMEQVSAHLASMEAADRTKRRFKKLLKFYNRDFSDTEVHYLKRWSGDLALSDDLIKEAYEKTVMQTGKVSFKYMDAILTDWHENGKSEAPSAVKAPKAAPKTRASKFSGYTQTGEYTDEDFDRIIANGKLTFKEE